MITPPPSRNVVTDANGLMTWPWQVWLRSLVAMVTGFSTGEEWQAFEDNPGPQEGAGLAEQLALDPKRTGIDGRVDALEVENAMRETGGAPVDLSSLLPVQIEVNGFPVSYDWDIEVNGGLATVNGA